MCLSFLDRFTSYHANRQFLCKAAPVSRLWKARATDCIRPRRGMTRFLLVIVSPTQGHLGFPRKTQDVPVSRGFPVSPRKTQDVPVSQVSIPSSSGHFVQQESLGQGLHHDADVSIPSSSGHFVQPCRQLLSRSPLPPVSIPSSSGHFVQQGKEFFEVGVWVQFQSPLHRGTSFNKK
jgi:hypothetical protein